jgi:hypothetical protein
VGDGKYYIIQTFIKIICIFSPRFVTNSGRNEGHNESIESMEDSCEYT